MSYLTCMNCKKKFSFYDKYDYKQSKTYCTNCNYEYSVITDTDEAVSSTGPGILLKFFNNKSIVEILFDNIPRDTLNKAFKEHKSLNTFELNPKKLLTPIKTYHDALKKRIHRFVTIKHTGTLISESERQNISKNINGYNLEKLINLLPRVIPSKSQHIIKYINIRKKIIQQIRWLRNKEEHINVTEWPIPSYIHTARRNIPSDRSRTKLNYMYLKRVNNFVIYFFLFLIRIDPINRKRWEYDVIKENLIRSNY